MACYHPLPASQDRPGASVMLHPPLGYSNLELPCGNCLGCFSDRALEWARRCAHEAARWSFNSFLTLTYADEHLPFGCGLEADELCKFFKRLRKRASWDLVTINRDIGFGVRYFAAGEYGEHHLRPHYHVLLFNCGFSDAQFVSRSNNFDLYESPVVSSLWRYGSHKIGVVTGASANYVAQYCMKKFGVDYGCLPKPFLRMSQKPIIGGYWVDSFSKDLSHGYLVVDGHRVRIPRAYMRRMATADGAFAETVAYRAYVSRCELRSDSHDPDRRAASELIHESKVRSSRSSF